MLFRSEPSFQQAPAARESVSYQSAGHDEFAKRPAPRAAEPSYRPATGSLDPMGRPAPLARGSEEELEIPAFLRRSQSNER